MKNVTDYFEITVAHGHINGIRLANFVRKKSQNIFHWHKLKILQISHFKKRRKLAEASSQQSCHSKAYFLWISKPSLTSDKAALPPALLA